MSLIKGKTGIYEALYRGKGRKPLHLSLRTEKKAIAKERHDAVHRVWRERRDDLIQQLRDGDVSVERVTSMVRLQEPLVAVVQTAVAAPAEASATSTWETVDATATRYLEWMRVHPNKADQTTTLAGHQLKRLGNFVFGTQRIGDLPMDRVPSDAILAYQRWMLDAEISPNTITTYMGRVATLWSWAIDIEARTAREQRRDPRELYSPVIPELMFRKKRPRDRMLSVDEANALIAATPPQMLWFVGCGLLAGLRAGEARHLRPGIDVDIDIGTITIRDQADWSPKTERSKRLVPMAPQLLEIARRHVATYANDAWMMPSPVDGTKPITDAGVRKYFIPIVTRTGMIYGRAHPQGVTYHTLRHSFASHSVMNGVDLYTLSKLLGDSMKTVEDVYADLSPDFKRAAVAKLAGAFTLPMAGESVTASVTEKGVAP